MIGSVKNLLDIARGQIGYCEKASNSDLDSFTANAGSNNYTKYARDLANAGYYQASKQGYEWCDMFVDWCFLQLCDKNPDKAQEMIFQTGPYGAGCECSANYYKNYGRLFYDNPQPGDQIFFGDYDHTGIVEAIDNGTIITIEGNAGNKVQRLRYNMNDSWITSFGRPAYDDTAEDNTSSTIPSNASTNTTTNTNVAKIHTVTAGESWWSIAEDEMGDGNRMYELAEFNNSSITKMLYVGNEIKIPDDGSSTSNNNNSSTPTSSEVRTHTVTAGESWWSIAEDEMGDGSKMNELAAFNGCNVTKMLYVGNVLKIPGTSSSNTTTSSEVRTHTVTAGESWWSIAEDEMGDGSKMNELAAFNGCTVNKMLYVGNVVKIPN